MNKSTLLLLTDLNNKSPEEDLVIGEFLKRDFKVTLMHPRESEVAEKSADAIIIRNIWNEDEYGKPEPWYTRWRANPQLPIHDDLYIRSGENKDYLLELYKNGLPVIPSVDAIGQLAALPNVESYFIKPKDGFDAINARKLTKNELMLLNPKHYLIQPFVDFEYEISFYYLDKQLQYTLYAPDKTKRWDLVEFQPSQSDIDFADTFIKWNPQQFGIERIDACRLKTGELLLVEITDQSGAYLSIPELSSRLRENFLENLAVSLKNTPTRRK